MVIDPISFGIGVLVGMFLTFAVTDIAIMAPVDRS